MPAISTFRVGSLTEAPRQDSGATQSLVRSPLPKQQLPLPVSRLLSRPHPYLEFLSKSPHSLVLTMSYIQEASWPKAAQDSLSLEA